MEARYFSLEIKTIYNTYRPVYTEAEGAADLAKGIYGLACCSLWRLRDSNDLGTGTPIATQMMQVSGIVIAQSLVKLSLPIILSTGYLLSRHYL